MRSVDLICVLSLPKDLAPATVDACTTFMYITHSHFTFSETALIVPAALFFFSRL